MNSDGDGVNWVCFFILRASDDPDGSSLRSNTFFFPGTDVVRTPPSVMAAAAAANDAGVVGELLSEGVADDGLTPAVAAAALWPRDDFSAEECVLPAPTAEAVCSCLLPLVRVS